MKTLALTLLANRPMTLTGAAGQPGWGRAVLAGQPAKWTQEDRRRLLRQLLQSLGFYEQKQPWRLPIQWAEHHGAECVGVRIHH